MRAAITAAGAIVTAAILLSGLTLIASYQQPVLAQEQQNMTGGGGAGNATNATMTVEELTPAQAQAAQEGSRQ